MKKHFTTKKTFLLAFLLVSLAYASTAQKLSMQGILKDANGKAVADGTQSITFKIYDALTGGNLIWSETQTVTVFGGVYSALLGTVNMSPTIGSLAWDKPYFVGLTIGGQDITPRTELTYAPYALAVNKAVYSDKLSSSATSTNYASVNAGGLFTLFGGGIGKFNIDNSGKVRVGIPNSDVNNNSSSISLAVGDTDTGLNQNGDGKMNVITDAAVRIAIGPEVNIYEKLTVGNSTGSGGSLYLGNTSHGIQRGYPTYNSNNNIGLYTTGGNIVLSTNGATENEFVLTDGGKVGIGTNVPQFSLAIGDADTGINSFGDGNLSIMTNNESRIKIMPGGRVGINNDDPQTGLHVGSSVTNSINNPAGQGNIRFIIHDNGGVPNSGSLNDVVAYFDGDIAAQKAVGSSSSITWSDKRIKNILQISNTKNDLETLKKIEITDYKYIDTIGKGDISFKKLIAQQVEAVFPQAVTKTNSVIPNVYELALKTVFKNGELTITTAKANDFVKGDRINLKTADKDIDRKEVIEVIDKNTFKIKSETNLDKIFVYGKWVNDFRAVDYDAISMLNVSATQELIRKIEILEKENAALKNSNGQLKAEIETTKKSQSTLEARLGAIESQLSKTASN